MAQEFHHQNPSNSVIRVVTAVDHCSWKDSECRKGNKVRITTQAGVCREKRGLCSSTVLLHPRFKLPRGRQEGL